MGSTPPQPCSLLLHSCTQSSPPPGQRGSEHHHHPSLSSRPPRVVVPPFLRVPHTVTCTLQWNCGHSLTEPVSWTRPADVPAPCPTGTNAPWAQHSVLLHASVSSPWSFVFQPGKPLESQTFPGGRPVLRKGHHYVRLSHTKFLMYDLSFSTCTNGNFQGFSPIAVQEGLNVESFSIISLPKGRLNHMHCSADSVNWHPWNGCTQHSQATGETLRRLAKN